MKIKWIKVGDVIEVDGKKAKLKSIVEDSTYQDVYTFKREDGSKFYWRHKEVYRYVMERHIRKLENLLSDEKQRADELEKRWSEMREYLEERIETSKVDCGDNKYIYSRYKTCKNTLFKMQRLEENNNA